MLIPFIIDDYIERFKPVWGFVGPQKLPPCNIDIPVNHTMYRFSYKKDSYDSDDFISMYELNPAATWGKKLLLAEGLSLVNGENPARLRIVELPQFNGIIELILNPHDGVVQQTGKDHPNHYTFWKTVAFSIENLKMLDI